MGTELTEYRQNLFDIRLALGGAGKAFKQTDRALTAMDQALDSLKKALKSADKLKKDTTNLEKAITVLKYFPPLKSLAKAADLIVEKAKDGADDLQDTIDYFNKSMVPYTTAITAMKTELKIVKVLVADARGDVEAISPGLELLDEVLGEADNDAQLLLDKYETAVENKLAALNAKFPAAKLQAFLDDTAAMLQAVEFLAELNEIANQVAVQFDKIVSKLGFLDGPFDALIDALEGVFWVLEKAAALIDKVLDPILTPILDAFGVTALIDAIGDAIADLLPRIDVFNPFLDVEDRMAALFGTEVNGSWELTLLGNVSASFDAFVSQLIGGGQGYIDPLLGNGSDNFDLLTGRWDPTGGIVPIQPMQYIGGNGDDVLIGGEYGDRINGGDGDDLIIATAGDDTVNGDTGLDDIWASSGSLADYSWHTYTLFGQYTLVMTYQGDDERLVGRTTLTNIDHLIFDGSLFGFVEIATALKVNYPNTRLDGTNKDDLMFGGNLADQLYGHGGDDRIIAFEDIDLVDGGAGTDTVDYSPEGISYSVQIVLDSSHSLYSSATDIVRSVENAIAGAGDDLIIGTNAANRLTGSRGNDTLFARSGNDTVSGGDGADTLSGGDGNDALLGSKGLDTYVGGRGHDRYTDSYALDDSDNFGFNTLIYGDGHSDWYNPSDVGGVPDVPKDWMPTYDVYDPGFRARLPDRIDVTVAAAGGYDVTKYFGGGTAIDTVEGRFGIIATEGNDTFELGFTTDVFDGAGGNDLFTGQVWDPATVPENVGEMTVFGSDGNDTLESYSGDENFIGGNGDDLFRLTVGSELGSSGAGWFIGGESPGFAWDQNAGAWGLGAVTGSFAPTDTGIDTVDLSNTDLGWQFSLDSSGTYLGGFSYHEDYPDQRGGLNLYGVERYIGSKYNDEIFSNSILSYADLGDGDDLFEALVSPQNIYVDGGTGDDTVGGGVGVDTVRGGSGNDRVSTSGNRVGGTESLSGQSGDDRLLVFNYYSDVAGTINLDGGSGLDVAAFERYSLGSSNAVDNLTLSMLTGTYTFGLISGSFKNIEAVFGDKGNNTIIGDSADNVLAGGAGIDLVTAGSGNDLLSGGLNTTGSVTADQLDAGDGDDVIWLSRGYHVVTGDGSGPGTDHDTLRFDGRPEWSTAKGLYITYDKNLSPWRIDIAAGTADQVNSSGNIVGGATFTGIDAFVGGLGDDTITAANTGSDMTGSDGDDIIVGGAGDDTLDGGRGDDQLIGGSGNDAITAGAGFDRATGGSGNDILDLRYQIFDTTIDATTGFADYSYNDEFPLLSSTAPSVISSGLRFSGFETYGLSDGADNFVGHSRAEEIFGNDGDDTIVGGYGADTIYGGSGNDDLKAAGGPNAELPGMVYMNQRGERDDYLMSSPNFDLRSGPMTMEFMINGDVPAANQDYALVSYATAGSDNEWTLFFTDDANEAADNFVLRIIINGALYDISGVSASSFLDGRDHRFSLTWDYGAMAVFLDGSEIWAGQVAGALASNWSQNGTLVFGQDHDGVPGDASTFQDQQAFIGAIGDIRIFDEVRSNADISADAMVALSDPANTSGLYHYWTVDADTETLTRQSTPETGNVGAPTDALTSSGAGLEWYEGYAPGTNPGDTIEGGSGDDTLTGSSAADHLTDAFGNTTITGGGGADVVRSGYGASSLSGQGADDLVIGGTGSDIVSGGKGDDVMVADISEILFGADTLDGGAGDDLMQGGRGSDTFIFRPNEGNDVIGKISVDLQSPSSSFANGADFDRRLDRVDLTAFGYDDRGEAYDQFSDVGGQATFSDQGTTITFFGLTMADLNNDQFLFV